jgi:hypothetical protein
MANSLRTLDAGALRANARANDVKTPHLALNALCKPVSSEWESFG